MGTMSLPVSPSTWWYERKRHVQKLSALTSNTSLPSAAISVVDSFSKVIVLNNSPGEQFRCWVSLIFYITVPCNRQRNTNIAAGTSGKWQMGPSSRGMAPQVWSHLPQHHGYIQLTPRYICSMWAPCGYLSSLCQPPKCCSKPHGTRDRSSSRRSLIYIHFTEHFYVCSLLQWLGASSTGRLPKSRDPPGFKSLW